MRGDLVGAAFRQQVAQVHHVDRVDEVEQDLQSVLNDQESNAMFIAQARDLLEDLISQVGRHTSRRLVQQQQLGLAHQSARDFQQFHLPAR